MMKNIVTFLMLFLGLGAFAQESADSLAQPTTEAEAVVLTPEQLWDKAGTAYINNDFKQAVKSYTEILDRGLSSSKLYYNLANAHFKADNLGSAILFYHRALRLAPGNADYRYNLSVAESHTKDTIEKVPEFFLSQWMRSVRRMMSCTAWSILSILLLIGALSLCLVYLLAQRLSLRKVGFYGTCLAGLLFVVTTWLAVGERDEMMDESSAVVMSTSVAVKSSPDKSATDLFVLHEGTTLHIENQLDGWCEVTIADGKKGWVEGRKIEVI